MVRWILIVAAALAALALIPVLIGLFLPRGHAATARATFGATPGALWAALTDFDNWPRWNKAVERMERSPDRDGQAVWMAVGSWGEMPFVVEAFEPPRRLVTRIPEDAGIGFSGTWTYVIEPADHGGSALEITEEGQVGNPLFRFMMLFHDQRATMNSLMTDLGRHLGEEVTPVAAR